MNTTIFTAEVDPVILAQANEVLAKNGVTMPEVLRRMMTYIAVEQRMPYFDCFEPNEETRAAMAEAEQGTLVAVGSVSDLMAELNEDD